jgi:hypothetical protein
MNRFDLDIDMKYRSASLYNSDAYYYWYPSEADRQLINWLSANISPSHRGADIRLPLFGKDLSWGIAEGFSKDERIDDHGWRYVMGSSYRPKGLFGIWLEVKDDQKAVELILNGVLDGCVWKGDRMHKHVSTSQWRSGNDPTYPRHFRR